MTDDAVRLRAEELGVQTSYYDVLGTHHEARPEVLRQVVDVLEADLGSVPEGQIAPIHLADGSPVAVGGAVADVEFVVGDELRPVGVRQVDGAGQIDLPADLPVGCHTLSVDTGGSVATCVVVVPPTTMPRSPELERTSALFVPTYALWEHGRPLPSLRHLGDLAAALPPLGVDVVSTLPLYATFLDDPFDPSPYSPVSRLHWNEVYLDDDGLPPAPVPTLGAEVDWRRLGERRRAQLVEAARHLDPSTAAAVDAFVLEHPDVAQYARFRAATEAGGDLVVERSHALAQYLADRQLAAIRDRPDAAAIALDLPIGSHPAGYEVWAHPELFATEMSVGAPPDAFFAEGQNWGFPPPLPTAGHRSGQQLWRQLIARVGRHADVLRIDHAMAVERLWWVPGDLPADRGVYVHYPREEILAVIAAAAATAGVTIVGEDLGTVPGEVAEAFDRWDVLGMYEEQFHLDDDPLPHIPARTVAGIRTHDMAALAEAVDTLDTTGYRARVGAAHGRDVADTWQDVLEQMLIRLSYSEAYMAIADLDDLLGEVRPHNLPGRIVPEIWRRRLDRPTSEILAEPEVRRFLATLARQR